MKSLPFDAAAVRALAGILADTGLTEIEVESKDGRIRVARAPAPVAATVAPTVGMPAGATAAGDVPEVTETADPDYAHHPGAVVSPMVGIIYLTPEPGAPPFVTVGTTVVSGQTLLLIEAMKTFNQIKATKAGTVTNILVASGTPVEYGQPLVIVE